MNTRRVYTLGFAALALVFAMSIGNASAHEGRGRGHKNHHGHGHVHHGCHQAHAVAVYKTRPIVASTFVVPRRIVRQAVVPYDTYYAGRAWFAPHHHAHVVYAFPVYTARGVIYEPSYYCDGALFVARAGSTYDVDFYVRRPRVALAVSLGF